MPATDSSPPAAAARRPSAPWLLGALALWLLATLGVRPLLLPDEGRYAEVARAMRHGDLLVPTLNGLPFFHKPPLFYWLDIAAMSVVGENVFAGRFGSFVGAWLMGAALFLALRRWHGERVAALTLGVTATTPFFFVGGQYANHDMLVGGLITAAVLAFARAVDTPPRVETRWAVAGWALCGLALLAKGLIGIVLPAFVIVPWLLVQRRWRHFLGLLHPLGPIAFAVVALPWLAAMQSRYAGFFDYFIVEQHFRRYAEANFNNEHGPWFFIAVLPLLTLPWSAWLAAAWQRVRSARGTPDGPAVGLYVWWVIAIVGFFTLPRSKLVGYALPALAPWCALLALAVADGGRRLWPRVMAAAAFACVAVVGVAAYKAPQSSRALALELAAKLDKNDAVVMVDEYYYDVPFYARLAQPVLIASRWDDPDVPRRDNWRKEVFDAARFDPTLGARLLVPLEHLETLGCGSGGATWYIAPLSQSARLAALPDATKVFVDQRAALWRLPPRACLG